MTVVMIMAMMDADDGDYGDDDGGNGVGALVEGGW